MKIGFVLGTFDPIHLGHIDIAIQCIEKNIIDKVFFVPTVQNPWKSTSICDFSQRCNLIKKSISEKYKDKIDVDDIEHTLSSPYYSCNTLNKLYEKYIDDDLYIIGGADIINDLPKWMNYDTMIKGKYKVIGFTRNNIEIQNNDIEYILINSSIPEISSTYIRNNIKNKEIIEKYISSSIIDECMILYDNEIH